MADDRIIGHGACPICRNTKARFTVSKRQLACMTCNTCNCQVFARSDSSDEKLRALIHPSAPAAPVATEAAAKVAPVLEPSASKPAPEETPTKKTGVGWGMLRTINGH